MVTFILVATCSFGQPIQQQQLTSHTAVLNYGTGLTDRLLAGPVAVHLNNPRPTDIGIVLEPGKRYTLVVYGTGGSWSMFPNSTDALYAYGAPGLPSEHVRVFSALRIFGPDVAFGDAARDLYGGYPPYNPLHVYCGVVTGDGKPLRVWVREPNERSYTDNSGAFIVSVHPAPPELEQKTSKSSTPTVDADVPE
jgi:hypothetical protein